MSAINVYIKKYTVALTLDTTYSLAGDWSGGYGFGIGSQDPNNVWISGRAIDVGPNTLLSNSFGTGVSYAFFQNDGSIQLKLMSNIKIFTESTFILGLTTKFNTRNINLVSSVRGISKNPVDHPNGGRANTKGSFKTP